MHHYMRMSLCIFILFLKSVNWIVFNFVVVARSLNKLIFCFLFFGISMNAFSQEHVVTMAGWEFDPVNLNVSVGDVVVWINDDDTRHKISFEDASLGGPARSNAHKSNVGSKFRFKFIKVGKYKYVCTTHEGQDMEGVVIVKDK